MKNLVINIDEKLHKEFKRTTADNEVSMKDVIVDSIKKYLVDNKKVVIH
jgi:hypothetical protein